MKPILFNGEMVRAILDGRKTRTRRVIKPRYRKNECGWSICRRTIDNSIAYLTYTDEDGASTRTLEPPYQAGDVLYVRETWNGMRTGNEKVGYHTTYWYKADDTNDNPDDKWSPSIHMPKEAARIFLKVTDLRVERLQDITIEEINNEGIDVEPPAICKKEMPTQAELRALEKATEREKEEYFSTLARHKYMGWCDYADNIFEKWKKLWDSTIPKNELDKCGWEANPFVWVIQFEQIEKPEQKG